MREIEFAELVGKTITRIVGMDLNPLLSTHRNRPHQNSTSLDGITSATAPNRRHGEHLCVDSFPEL